MIVVCVLNKVRDLKGPKTDLDMVKYSVNNNKDYKYDLTIKKRYVVYGISFRSSLPWYYICDDSFTNSPKLISSLFFEILDGTLSRYWQFNQGKFAHYGLSVYPRIVLPKWANDDNYDEQLFDGDLYNDDGTESIVQNFLKYKQLIDKEFPINLAEDSRILQDNWLQCKICENVWESSSENSFSICTHCGMASYNPLYQSRKGSV